MSYQPTPQKKKGGQQQVQASDQDVRELLQQILIELKIMRTHLHVITEENIKEMDTR